MQTWVSMPQMRMRWRRSAAPGVEERAASCPAKCEFACRFVEALGEGGGKVAELFGVLFGGGGGNAEGGRGVEEAADVPFDLFAAGDDVQEFFLRVDDQERRVAGAHELGRADGFRQWLVGRHE